MGAGLGIVIHVGRRTSTVYRTPVNVFRTKDGFRFALTYGRDAEWVQNALAHGAVRLVTRHKEYELTDPELVHDPHRQHVPRPAARVLGSCGCRTSWTSGARLVPAPIRGIVLYEPLPWWGRCRTTGATLRAGRGVE